MEEGKVTNVTIKNNKVVDRSTGGAVYGLGLIGAAVYFLQNATGFWNGVLGLLKALVWPAFIVYEAFQRLYS